MEKRNKADLDGIKKLQSNGERQKEEVCCRLSEIIGEVNCMGESEGKRIFYKGSYRYWIKMVGSNTGVYPQDIADAEFIINQ